jgi:hypothetical protein
MPVSSERPVPALVEMTQQAIRVDSSILNGPIPIRRPERR